MSAVPPGSILSSPVSLEPHPYEESRTNKREISMVENPHVSTNSIGAALSNPIYGADDGNVYHTISSGQENEYEDPNKNEINCASYEVPVAECGAGERASVCKKSAAKPDYAMVIENQNAVDSEVGPCQSIPCNRTKPYCLCCYSISNHFTPPGCLGSTEILCFVSALL